MIPIQIKFGNAAADRTGVVINVHSNGAANLAWNAISAQEVLN